MIINNIQNKKLIKNKHFWIMIIFWMLVGASSRAFYDLQLLFEGMFDSASRTNYIIAGSGIFAAVIGAPIVGLVVDKCKKYKRVVFIMISFLIFSLLLIPLLTNGMSKNISYYLILGVSAPLVGIGYSYRSVLDPFASAYTQTNSIPATITRGFYAVGAGLFSVVMLTLIKYSSKNNYSYMSMYYIFMTYVSSLVLLMLFIGFSMKEPKHNSSHVAKKHGVKISDFKLTFQNKTFWIGLIAMFFLIGMAESLDSVNKHAAYQNKDIWGNENDTVMYIDLIRMFPECLFYIFTSLIFMKFGLKKSGILSSIIFMACGAVLSFSTYFNIKWLFIIMTAITTPMIVSLCLGLGYEFITSESPYSVRGFAGTVFNAITYGLGGVLFFLINGPIFDAHLGYILYAMYSGICIIPLIIFSGFMPNIQSKVKLNENKKQP